MAFLTDPWLLRWLPLINERAGSTPVLEIGCGHGDDTAVLCAQGLSVIAFDLSRLAVAAARLRAPAAAIECRDIRSPFPPAARHLGVVLASLSLHYFAWDESCSIVQRIHAVLRPGGLLLCRLNSTEDWNFGANEGVELEPHYRLVGGQPKRFFDQADVQRLFAQGWQVRSLEHKVTSKYARPKALWEVALERAG